MAIKRPFGKEYIIDAFEGFIEEIDNIAVLSHQLFKQARRGPSSRSKCNKMAKEMHNILDNITNLENRTREIIGNDIKFCSKCSRNLPATETYFMVKMGAPDGLWDNCRECHNRLRTADSPFVKKVRGNFQNRLRIDLDTKGLRSGNCPEYCEHHDMPYGDFKEYYEYNITNGWFGIPVNHIWKIIGYSPEELVDHLRNKYIDGMNDDNYGKGKETWLIDHIVPLKAFGYETCLDEEFQLAWSLDNIQPLWVRDANAFIKDYDLVLKSK